MAPRTLDLDLILYGEEIIDEDGLSVPHPRFREREFVLGPLAEIAPDMIDPVTRQRSLELLTGEKIRRIDKNLDSCFCCRYSYRSATIGSSAAAFRAG